MDGMNRNDGMQTTEETITPLIAEKWLKSNVRNRTPNLGRVATIAAEILAGRWVVNGDAIRFGKDGTLYDGQHRLMAICKAAVAVRSNVVRGLEPEARDFIDLGGLTRTAKDVVAITDGVKISHMHVAWVAAAERMLRNGTLNGRQMAMSAADLRHAFANHKDALAGLAEPLGCGSHRRLVSAAPIGAFLIAWRTAPKKTYEFAQAVKTGEGLARGNPALTFRNYLIAQQGTHIGAATREDLALRTFAALDAFILGEPLKILRPNESARDRYIAAWKDAAAKGKAAPKLSVVPPASAPQGKFREAIMASQLRDTKKRTPDAPPPPVEVLPPKHSNTKTLAQIADVRKYLSDGKTHRTMEIASACDIPKGSIFRVLTEALDVRNVSPGVWALKKAG